MSAKACITAVIIILVLPLALLQGCGDSSSQSDPATSGQGLRLTLSSANDVTALLANGGSSVQLHMQVTTQRGEALGNIPVVFSTTAGTLSAVTHANVVNNARPSGVSIFQTAGHEITVRTDANGLAVALLTSSHVVESAVVAAEAEGFKQSIRIDFISGFPEQLSLSSNAHVVSEGRSATITARVSDAKGHALSGVIVNFQLVTNGSSGASVSPTSATTDVNGHAQTTYQAGTTSGIDTIAATISTVATSAVESRTISATASITVQPEVMGNLANHVQLLVSSPQLDSDGVETVILTALVRDSNNNLLPDVPVTFRTVDSSAAIQVTRATTDETGTAEAILSTGGDRANRIIRLQAMANGLIGENAVQVSGTTLTFSGNPSLARHETGTLSILLRDSSGAGIADQPITLSQMVGNALVNGDVAAEVTTGFNGQATFDVTVSDAGTYTIQATALGALGTFDILVNASDFIFITPESLTEVPLSPNHTICLPPDTPQVDQPPGCLNVSIHFEQDGIALNDGLIEFTTTRGHFGSPAIVPPLNGNASVVVRANNAGFAEITAICRDPNPQTEGDVCDSTPTIQRVIEFVATEADTMSLEANPASIGVNADGVSNEQSTITAIVRDAANNLVKNKRIDFTLDDITGGSINPAFAITDSFGRASTVYTAGPVSSSSNGVVVTAVVNDTPTVTASEALTVANKALFIKVGTANVIFEESDVLYRYPYSVIVTDASGNSVPGVRVDLSVTSTRYQKGFYLFDAVADVWVKSVSRTCLNEDRNGNGILEPDEDRNGNSILDPGEVAAVTEVVVTNDDGIGLFDLLYAQEFTWVEVELTARAIVAGTESLSSATFFLPGVASDFNSREIVPPGQTSPFGVSTGCTNTD